MLHDDQPTIRTENPPKVHLDEATRLVDYHPLELAGFALLALSIVVLITAIFSDQAFVAFLALVCGSSTGWGLYTANTQKEKLLREKSLPLPSHIYNREYTAPLADNSVIRTNIFFTLPLAFAHKDQQLDTFTEKEFLIFVATKTKPPTAEELQNHLSKKLRPFQDENQIPFLRVEISLHIHIPAQKPKGGGVVSV